MSISRILGCRGVAVLPAGMSRERFEWLEQWVTHPDDIVRTPGTESNVKEIYDKCAELERDPQNVILNQFSAFSNYMIHYTCTGAACEHVFTRLQGQRQVVGSRPSSRPPARPARIAAGDYLKKRHGTQIAAVEALECPTMLKNGYGEHNIQGIGDKHIPLIHNVMNTDVVIGVSDRVTDQLNLLFGSEVGRNYLRTAASSMRRWLHHSPMSAFPVSPTSSRRSSSRSSCTTGRTTSSSRSRPTARRSTTASATAIVKSISAAFDEVNAGEVFGSCLTSIATDNVIELTDQSRRQIFNLGYYTWVEQQGVSVEDFERRRHQSFWDGIAAQPSGVGPLIEEFNAEVAGSNTMQTAASKARS